MNWRTHTPAEIVVALCEGDAYDAENFEGKRYFVATYAAGWGWITGKYQNGCKVNKWVPLSELEKPNGK